MRFSLVLAGILGLSTTIAAPIRPAPAYYVESSGDPQPSSPRLNRAQLGKVALHRPSPADKVATSDPYVKVDSSSNWKSFHTKWMGLGRLPFKSQHDSRDLPNVVDSDNAACTGPNCHTAAADLDCLANANHNGLCSPKTSTGSSKGNSSAIGVDTDSSIFTPASYADDQLPDLPQGSA